MQIVWGIILHYCLKTHALSSFPRRVVDSAKYQSECESNSLGMANGAIASSQIACSSSSTNPFPSICDGCRHARAKVNYQQGRWWCVLSSSTDEWFQVSFKQLVVMISTFIEAWAPKGDSNKYYPAKVRFSSSEETASNATFIPYYYKDVMDVVMSKSIGDYRLPEHRLLRHFRITLVVPSSANYSILRFEFYGCGYWEYAEPLGMSNKFVRDEQISSFSIENRDQNPLHSRLNMAQVGWFPNPFQRPQLEGLPEVNFFLQITFSSAKKVIYIAVQTEMVGDKIIQRDRYGIRYGMSENDLLWYSHEGGNMRVVYSPFYDIPNIKLIHVFEYSLVGKIFQYLPFCGEKGKYGECCTTQIELYGVPKTTADHEWWLGPIHDNIMYQDFLSMHKMYPVGISNIISIYYGSIDYRFRQPAQSMPFPLDDCVLSPEKCNDGLSVSFWARVPHLVHDYKHVYEVLKPSSIFQYNNTLCSSADDAILDLNLPIAIYVEHLYVSRYTVLKTAFMVIGMRFNSPMILSIHMNVVEEFVSTCKHATTDIQPIVTTNIPRHIQGYLYIPIEAFNIILNSPLWSYGSSIAFVLRKANSAIVDSTETENQGRVQLEGEKGHCDSYKTDIISNLPLESFSQTGNCTEYCASDARFGQNGWIPTDKDDQLIINLKNPYEITMLKVASSKRDVGQEYIQCTFLVFYSNDETLNNETQFTAVPYTPGSTGFSFKRRLRSPHAIEHIALPDMIVARMIVVKYNVHSCSYFPGLRLDIVTCEKFPVTRESTWLKLNEDPVCFYHNAKGEFSMTSSYHVTSFKLVQTNGTGIRCTPNQPYKNFGCRNDNTFSVFLATSKDAYRVIAPLKSPNLDWSDKYFLKGFNSHDPEVILQSQPVYFRQNEIMQIWEGQTLFDKNFEDNDGHVCVDVFGWGKRTPGLYISQNCPDVVCACLSINDLEELIFHRNCKDLFYFSSEGHMVHVNTGKCILKVGVNFKLDDHCRDTFNVIKGGMIYTSGVCIRPQHLFDPSDAADNIQSEGSDSSCTLFMFSYEVPRNDTSADVEIARQKYHFAAENMLYADAENYCETRGYHLPVLHNKYELLLVNTLLSDKLPTFFSNLWLGVENYITADGSPYDYSTYVSEDSSKTCRTANRDGVYEQRDCVQTTPYGVICEVPRSANREETIFLTNGLHRTKYARFGKGFLFSLAYGETYPTLTVMLQTDHDTYELDIRSTYGQWHLYTMTWLKGSELLKIYVDGILFKETNVTRREMIVANSANDMPFKSNFISLGGPYHTHFTSYAFIYSNELKIWRHSLSADDVKDIFSTRVTTFSEQHSVETMEKNWKIATGCSDHEKLTGPCYDADTFIHRQGKEHNISFDCVWSPGEGEGTSRTPFSIVTKRQDCANLCKYQFEVGKSFSGATYNKNTKQCYCETKMEADAIDSTNAVNFYTCYLSLLSEEILLLASSYVTYATIYHAPGTCSFNSENTAFPRQQTDKHSVGIFQFQLNMTSHSDVRYAYIKLLSTGSYSNNFTLKISLMQKETFKPTKCESFTSQTLFDLVRPTYERIGNWIANTRYLVDVTSHLQFMLRKSNWQEGDYVTFHIDLELHDDSVKDRRINARKTQLLVYYELREKHPYIYFPSKPSAIISSTEFTIPQFAGQWRALSFWLFMFGDDVGALFVWQIFHSPKKLLFRLKGSQGNVWQQIWVQLDQLDLFEISFAVVNNLGIKGHIAIDHVEGFNDITSIQFTDQTKPKYHMTDMETYKEQLSKLNLSQPAILYPFNTISDFGLLGLDLQFSNVIFHQTDDKYGFPNHAFVSVASHRGYIKTKDFYDTSKFKNEFTFLLHFMPSQVTSNEWTIFKFGEVTSPNSLKLSMIDTSLKISIVNNGMKAEYFGYTKTLAARVWHYVGIVFADGILKLYFNNELDLAFTVPDGSFDPFPSPLYFVRDDADLELPPKETQFQGALSCFQAHNKSLTRQEMMQLEFCPNRQEEYYYTGMPTCENGGMTVPFVKECVCPEFQLRYSYKSCGNALLHTSYNDSIVYVSFDRKGQTLGEKRSFNLNENMTNFVASPINKAVCVFNESLFVGSVNDTCLSSMTGCQYGYSIGFWLYVSTQVYHDTNTVNIVDFNGMKIDVSNIEQSNYSMLMHISINNCHNTIEDVGSSNWNYFLISITKSSFTIIVNGERNFSTDCSTGANPLEVENQLFLRTTSKVCMDEFSITYNDEDTDLSQNFYTDINRGHITSDEEIMLKYTEIQVLVKATNVPASSEYEEAYPDLTSSEAQSLKALFFDMLNETFSSISDNYIGAEVLEFSSTVQATLSLYFSYFGLEEESYFYDAVSRDVSYVYDFQILSSTWKPVIGVPDAVNFKVESPSPYSAYIHMENRLPQEERNHYGYRVLIKKLPYQTESETEELRTYITGASKLYFNVSIYRKYNVTLWPISHTGYGKRSFSSFLSSIDKNRIAPHNITGEVLNQSSITIHWRFDTIHWSGPNIQFYVYYTEVTFDKNLTKLSAYSHSSTGVYNITSSGAMRAYQLQILDLKPFTNYSFILQTSNSAGFGVSSEPVFYRSTEWYPELIPTIINVTLHTVYQVNISWSHIHDIELYNSWNITSFLVTERPVYPSLAHIKNVTNTMVLSNESSMLSSNHEAFQFVHVNLSICNDVGCGPPVEFCFATGETVPTMGPNIAEIKNISSTTVSLLIGGTFDVAEENGVITHYFIRYKPTDWIEEFRNFTTDRLNHSSSNLSYWEMMKKVWINCSQVVSPPPVSTELINVTFESLTPFVIYGFHISTCTQVGCGLNDETTVIVKTLPDYPICHPNITEFQNDSSTSAYLYWNHLYDVCTHGDLQGYYVIFLDTYMYSHFIGNSTFDVADIPVNNIYTTLENYMEFPNLRKYWNYSTIIYIKNQVGFGPFSPFHWMMTAEDKPDGPPTNTTATVLNSSAVLLTMALPQPNFVNGIILGYHVIDELGRANNVTVTRVNETATNFILTGLLPFTEYKFRVSAYTKVGAGPFSLAAAVLTHEELPSAPPSSFATTNQTSSNITVTWKHVPTTQKHGVILYFLLHGNGTLANSSVHDLDMKNISHANLSMFAFNQGALFPATLYDFYIQACNMAGCSEFTSVNGTTLEMKPSGSVKNCMLIKINQTNSMSFEWLDIDVMERRGKIISYNISYKRMKHPWEEFDLSFEQFFVVDSSVYSIIITNLDNYTDYDVHISGITRIGEGPRSSYIFRSTENVPSVAPTNITANNISSSVLNVKFQKIEREFHEGELLGYKVLYQQVDLLLECLNNTEAVENCYNTTILFANSTEGSINITGLGLNVNYSVCVRGYTSIGDGPLSLCVYVETDTYVDGNWTMWTNWGFCDQSCANGSESRYRWCMDPFPENGGADCEGDAIDKRPCNDFPCPAFYLAEPNTDCDATCKRVDPAFTCMEKKVFTKDSTNVFTTAMDPTDYTKQVNISCIVSTLTSDYINDIHPVYNLQTSQCEGFANIPSEIKCTAPNELSLSQRKLCSCLDFESANTLPWAQWSPCSATCGGGVKRRYRTCLLESGECSMTLHQQDCNVEICKIDGMWGDWGNSSDCDISCGYGKRIRRRLCDSPKPRYGGKECVDGTNMDVLHGCNPYPCPIDGMWGEWLELEECTQPCGTGGNMLRRRYCNNPAPKYKGSICPGARIERLSCNEDITCKEAKVTILLKLPEVQWNYRMVYEWSQEFRNVSQPLTEALLQHVSYPDTNYEVVFNRLWRGSVNANFSLYFTNISTVELIKIQHAIDLVGFLHSIPVQFLAITSDDVPFDPPSFTATCTSPFNINVTWSKVPDENLNGNFTLYYVHYRLLSQYPPAWTIMGSQKLWVELRDLQPGSAYGLRLAVAIDDSKGIATKELTLSTKEGEPLVEPPNFQYTLIDANTVYIEWDAIPLSQIPGNLIGYKITYRSYFSNQSIVTTNDAAMLLRTLKDLNAFTLYWVEVCGFTVAGCGPSNLLIFETPQTAPSVAPPNVTVHDLFTSHTVLLTWDAIPKEHENSDMKGYAIVYQLVRTSDVDVVEGSALVHTVHLDKFTFSYTMKDLLPYSLYVVNIFGYANVGNGPSKQVYARTCKCPENVYTNYFQMKPYMSMHPITDQISGIFANIIPGMVKKICGTCKTYKHPNLYFNKTHTGHPPSKLGELYVRGSISSVTHINFPIYGKFNIPIFMGNQPYLGVVLSQGSAMIVTYEKVKIIEITAILTKLASAWTVLAVGVLLSCIIGLLFWMTEQSSTESDIQLRNPIIGAFQGLWMALVSMTTVGYGDIVPSTNSSKSLMLIWVLVGLIVVSVFLSVASSSMTIINQEEKINLYGAKVAAIYKSWEYQLAIVRNAEVDGVYNTTMQVLSAVAEKKVKIALIDAATATSYLDFLTNNMSLKVHKIIDSNAGFGLVLAGGMKYVADDCRSHIDAMKPQIQATVEKSIDRLMPPTLKTDVELLPKDSLISMMVLASEAYLALAVIGILVSVLLKCRRRRKVHSSSSQDDVNEVCKVVQSFTQSFREKVEEKDLKNTAELIELATLKSNYKKLLIRRGYSEEDAEKRIRRKKKTKRKRLVIESNA